MEIERAYKEITEANQVKSEFLANMSHELRTPLNSILALSEILLSHVDGQLSGEQEKQLGIINRNGKSLLDLINNILDFSNIQSGRMQLSYSRFHVEDLFNSVKLTILPLIKEKNLNLVIEKGEQVSEHHSESSKAQTGAAQPALERDQVYRKGYDHAESSKDKIQGLA